MSCPVGVPSKGVTLLKGSDDNNNITQPVLTSQTTEYLPDRKQVLRLPLNATLSGVVPFYIPLDLSNSKILFSWR